MSHNLERLKRLLAEIFQLDQAELDFGIYRIMNTKRDEIIRFLDRNLLPQVREAFQNYESENRGEVEVELAQAIQKAKELGADPETLPRVKELRAKLAQAVDVTDLENEVYSHLFSFFRRYYQEGDFLSLRRYKEGVYAIPYEGEEVKLHWANHDQYYIKTSEYLRDYNFRLPSGNRVHFKLVEADTDKDNNRAANGNERRFILCQEQPLAEENGELVVRFDYRPHPDKAKQADLNTAAVDSILNQTTGFDAWRLEFASLRPTEKNTNRTLLEKYITDYTARNTFDYFIHKDLGGFLLRELDFYIKNEIMHLDDVESNSAPRVEQYLSKIKAIRRIAHKIIDFLAQLENFQKKLWLKKKFVVKTQYCVTLDCILAIGDGETQDWLVGQIIENQAQREEWINLFAINEIKGDLTSPSYSNPLTEAFLRAYPTLVVDTKNFDRNFVDRLLASFEDLDRMTDGLLVHSENSQALNLLLQKYQGKVKCIYIDPPYNTEGNSILYKNNYRHSSWLSLMQPRICLSMAYEVPEFGVHVVAIDNAEESRLKLLLEDMCVDRKITCVSIIHNPGGTMGKNFSDTGEYALFIYDDSRNIIAKEDRIESPDVRDLMNTAKGSSGNYLRSTGKTCFYPILVRDSNIVGFGDVCSDEYHPAQNVLRSDGIIEVYPIDNEGVERKWVLSRDTVEKHLSELHTKIDVQTGRIRIERRKTEINYKTVWIAGKYSAKKYGTEMLGHIIPETRNYPRLYPKSIHLVRDCVHAGLGSSSEPVVLDYFAGSGTTGHAVINLNREDGDRRKFILAEMGDHFDAVLLPRIKKVTFSPVWKDGKPERLADAEEVKRSPRIVKVIYIESYEDTLNNLDLRRTEPQKTLLERQPEFWEDYILRYMLDVETRESSSLLNVHRFENPFDYKLNIATGSAGETKPTAVDLVETFNYLVGLRVKTIDNVRGVRVVTGTNPQGERVLILWRKAKELDNDALDAWLRKQGYNTKDQEYDVIYVNGDNNLENLRKPDQTWKVRLIEEEFRRLMFDVQDV